MDTDANCLSKHCTVGTPTNDSTRGRDFFTENVLGAMYSNIADVKARGGREKENTGALGATLMPALQVSSRPAYTLCK